LSRTRPWARGTEFSLPMIHLNCTASRESHVVIKIEFPINIERGVGFGKADDLVIDQTCSLGGRDDIEVFNASLFAFGRNDPYCPVTFEVVSEALELFQFLQVVGQQKDCIQPLTKSVFPD